MSFPFAKKCILLSTAAIAIRDLGKPFTVSLTLFPGFTSDLSNFIETCKYKYEN